jgi:hypothetical protein
VQRRQHDEIEDGCGDRSQDEEALEDRLVGAQVHEPRRDQEELHHHHREQEHDDETVGDVALHVGDGDLHRGDHREHDRDDDVLPRVGVGPHLARQQVGRRVRHAVGEVALGQVGLVAPLPFGHGAWPDLDVSVSHVVTSGAGR